MTRYVIWWSVTRSPLSSIYGFVFSWSGLLCSVLFNWSRFPEIRQRTRTCGAIRLIEAIQVRERSRPLWLQGQRRLMPLASRLRVKVRTQHWRQVLSTDREGMGACSSGHLSWVWTRSSPPPETVCGMAATRSAPRTPSRGASLPTAATSGVIRRRILASASRARQCLVAR